RPPRRVRRRAGGARLTALARRPVVPATRLPRGYLAAVAIVPLVALVAIMVARIPQSAAASVGALAPDFAVTDLRGNPVVLSQLRGRPVIVNFWASWCTPCLEEFPRLGAALDRHRDAGLAVIGVVYQDQWSSASDYMDDMRATWPAVMDPGGRLAAAYGVYGPPQSVFIDRGGVVRAQQFGPFDASALERHLARILPEVGS
ncbi:MAG: TlpA family protein disulfide reductase, partial [Candidatus Limnocylindria bacterium]